MKTFLAVLLLVGLIAACRADIQDPPANDYGPTRKLGRGLSNMFFGLSEVPVSIGLADKNEGNAASLSLGVVRGVGRGFARFGVGFYEAALWPLPLYRGTYFPVLRSDIPWIHRGYGEFPPELGSETKYDYVRQQ